jgi:hypothetical protein
MELRTVDGQLRPSGAFKLIATGYFLGVGAIMVPLFTIATLITLGIHEPMTVNGHVVAADAPLLLKLMPIVLVPIIIAGQSVLIGGAVVFGLWLYQKRRPIRVLQLDATDIR